MDFEWDTAKSERTRIQRDLPFALALPLFDGPIIEWVNTRRHYGEIRMRAIGMVGRLVLLCVYTGRGQSRRIIGLRRANRSEWDACRTAQTN